MGHLPFIKINFLRMRSIICIFAGIAVKIKNGKVCIAFT